MRLIYQNIINLPIRSPQPDLLSRLESVAQSALSGDIEDSDHLNSLVYSLYRLSDGETALVNDWITRRNLTESTRGETDGNGP